MTLVGYGFVGLCYHRIYKNVQRILCALLSVTILSYSTFPVQTFAAYTFFYSQHYSKIANFRKSKMANSSQAISLISGRKPATCQFQNSILIYFLFAPLICIGSYAKTKKYSGVANIYPVQYGKFLFRAGHRKENSKITCQKNERQNKS